MPTFGRDILFVCFRSQLATVSERCFFGSRYLVAVLSSLADFAFSVAKKPSTRMHLMCNRNIEIGCQGAVFHLCQRALVPLLHNDRGPNTTASI